MTELREETDFSEINSQSEDGTISLGNIAGTSGTVRNCCRGCMRFTN
jgi:hypothetical protein